MADIEKLSTEEILELINMHARTMVDVCICEGCGEPIKEVLEGAIARILRFVDMLPDHHEVDEVHGSVQ